MQELRRITPDNVTLSRFGRKKRTHLEEQNGLAEDFREPKRLCDVVDDCWRQAEYQDQQVGTGEVRQENVHLAPLESKAIEGCIQELR